MSYLAQLAVYHIRVKCANCPSAETLAIPQSQSVSNHLQFKACRRCGKPKLYHLADGGRQ